jgi:hypothetical protein
MKKKIYILVISILTMVMISTAFIPIQRNKVDRTGVTLERNKIIHNDPEAGYIEDIGN